MLRAELNDESRSEAKEHAAFYLRGREASTISTYNSEYKRLVEFYKESGKMGVIFEERVVVSFIVWRSGGWRSSAVDTFIQVVDACVRLGDAVL